MSGALSLNNAPVSLEEFARSLEAFAPLADRIALAVSGGADSMALALCAARALRPRLHAFVVDHRLRAGSDSEASLVCERLASLGIEATILVWEHGPIEHRLQERARAARYQLLLAACRTYGMKDLLIGHHRDDQAETILMRLCKGSGLDGLTGMAAASVRDDVRILRPFLSYGKERLIETCHAASITFVNDVGNQSDQFARGRLRRIMPLLESEGMTINNLLQIGAHAYDARTALESDATAFLKRGALPGRAGHLRLDRDLLRSLPRAVALRALVRCLRYVHEGAYPPEHDTVRGLYDLLVGSAVETARTLHGCIASFSEKRVTFLREPAAVKETCRLSAGSTVLWDKRWIVTSRADTAYVDVRALGNQAHRDIDRLAATLRHQVPQGRVRASLPSLWIGDVLHAIPSFDEKEGFHMAYRNRHFPNDKN